MRISDWSSDVCSSDLAGWQRQFDHDIADLAGRDRLAFGIEHAQVEAGHRYGCRAGLDRHRLDAARIGDRRPAQFGLPPVVDHRSLQLRGGPVDGAGIATLAGQVERRSEEHTSELQSLMRISYAVFCLNKQTNNTYHRILNISQPHAHT